MMSASSARADSLAHEAARMMVAAAWHSRRLPAEGDQLLALSLQLARTQLVERRLLDTYRDSFPASARRELEAREDMFWSNLSEAARRLRRAGLEAVLIKSGLESVDTGLGHRRVPAAEYGDFDLVIGADGWNAAHAALEGWGQPDPPHPLEPHKLLLRPGSGPGAHLHRDAEWFGVPVISGTELRARCRPLPGLPGILLPTPADALRLWVAHAVFQNLSFGLSELLEVRRLDEPNTVAEASERAAREGWGVAFGAALALARRAIAELDAGGLPALPLPLPPLSSLLHGWRHAGRLLVSGRGRPALRELVLRPALVAAKWRRTLVMSRLALPMLVGVAGPDGSGKSTLAAGIARSRARGARAGPVVYLYGCAVCRRWPGRPVSAGLEIEPRPAGLLRRRLRSLHALVDAAEMTARLLAAIVFARVVGRDLVVTDRTPLDALVKHDLGTKSVAGRWFLALARRYQTVLWLDADPATLFARDGEHAPGELAASRMRFASWAQRLPNAVRLETGVDAPAEICEQGLHAAGV
jgi:hypothetical protein